MKQIKILIIILSELIPVTCFSQGSSEGNLQKYWKYRERLKNFVVVGNINLGCQGCSSPAESRGINGPAWSDATDRLGYYIGMLATEYKLLNDQIIQGNDPNGDNSSQLQETKKELYYALEKFNTLDCLAEWWWTDNWYPLSGESIPVPYTSECMTYDDPPHFPISLNGFFVRDDIPFNYTNANGHTTYDFGNYIYPSFPYNGDLIENYLTSSLVPLPDGYRAKDFTNSAYHAGIVDDHHGPREESQDHIIRLMEGWALVSKLVDVSAIYTDGTTHITQYFADGETSFVQEVKNQCERVVSWMYNGFNDNNWLIHNPTYPGCSMGVCNITSCDWTTNCNGADAQLLQYGFSCAECCIANSFPSWNGNNYSCHTFNVSGANKYLWNHCIKHCLCPFFSCQNDQYQKIFELAAIGRVWDSETSDILANKCVLSDEQHIPLLYDVLWGGENCHTSGNFSNNFYACLLDVAPCNGTNHHFPNGEWGNGDRVLNGSESNTGLDESYGVDYMLYFNLFQILNPSYSNYRYIKPQELCPVNLIKGHWTENDKKNFLASNSITAGNVVPDDYDYVTNTSQGDYIIENDNDPNQPDPYRRAQVTFTAGHYIDLLPGFEAKAGVLFDASIDATMKPIQCSDVSIGFGHCPTNGTNPYGRLANSNIITDSTNTGVFQSQSKILIKPNPSSGIFTLTCESTIQTIEVKDIPGNIIYRQIINKPAINMDIDLSSYPKGIYILQAQTAGKIYTEKIVIQ
jgi:hypothetical protein